MRNFGLFAAFFANLGPLLPQAPGQIEEKKPTQGIVQRRVLIFDFENQTGKIEFDYLSGSIADALVDSVRKTGKFRLMLREEARMNTFVDKPAPTQNVPDGVANSTGPAGKPANDEPNSAEVPDKPVPTPQKAPTISVSVSRNEAIRRGREAGADVVVLGKFSELNGVLLMSAQAYESDTRLLKVSEEVLTKSDSEMFTGITLLATKIAESMARELPMFDFAEAERRKAEAASKTAEIRDWEFQFFAGMPLLHPLYSSDGTITYSKGIPVQKLSGYSLGATAWESAFARRFSFMPRGARFGLQSKISLLTGQADLVGTNSTVLTTGAALNGVFVSGHLLFGLPYWQSGRFAAYAEIGPGIVYTRLATAGTTIFSSVQPGAVLGTSAAYLFSYWSLGLSYRAQVTWFAQNQAFMEHGLWMYAGVRL